MAQQVKAFTAKPEDLSSIPGTYMVEGEEDAWKLSSDVHTHGMVYVPLCMYTHIYNNKCAIFKNNNNYIYLFLYIE